MNNIQKLVQIEKLAKEVRLSLQGQEPPRIPENELEFKNGNLWKPESESTGNLVVLLRSDWPLPSRVDVLTKGDVWERMDYAGSDHNGNRHHYRGNHPGSHYAGKRKNGGVRFSLSNDPYVYNIPLPGRPKERHE